MIDLKIKPPRIPFWLLLKTLLAVCFAFRVLTLFFTIDRGFDIGDEGSLLLMYRHFDLYPYNFFAKFSHALFIQEANPVSQYRVYKYICDLLSCIIFAGGGSAWFYSAFVEERTVSIRTVLAAAGLFSLLGFALSPYSPALSYNDLTNVFLSTIAALMLLLLAATSRTFSLSEFIICFFLGVAFHLQAVVKMEITQITGCLLLVCCFLLPARRLLIKAGYILSFLAGFALLIFIFGPNPHLRVSEDLKHAADYSVLNILSIYFQNDFYHIPIFAAFVSLFCLFMYLSRRARYPALYSLCASAIPVLGFAKYFYHLSPYDLQLDLQLCLMASLFICWLSGIVPQGYAAQDKSKGHLYRNILVFSGLSLFPFILIAGTNSTLTEAMPLVSFPWFAMAGLLIYQLIRPDRTRAFALLVSAGLLISTSFQFVHSRISHPFMLRASIASNNVNNKYLYNIKTDQSTLLFCSQLTDLMRSHGYEAGDTIVTMGFTSGIAYMLDARMELTAFYLPSRWGDSYNCFCLRNIAHRPKFVILPTDQVSKFDSCFDPQRAQHYDYLDSIHNPYSDTYYKNKDHYLRVFKIKNQGE